MSRQENFEAAIARFSNRPNDDGELRKEFSGQRYLTVSTNHLEEQWLTLYETLDAAQEGLAEEAMGENVPWSPWFVIDLDDGQMYYADVSVSLSKELEPEKLGDF